MNTPTAKPERELKLLLTKKQYDQLLATYDFEPAVKQINTYYDTPDSDLKKMSSALRIRSVNQQNLLTVKQPLDEITKSELEYVVSAPSLSQLPASELQPITSLVKDFQSLKPLTTFTTYRSYLKTENGEFCLDKNVFSDFTDYELEYEYKTEHDGISVLNAFLKPIGLTYTKNGPSKIARAMSNSK